MRKRGGRSASTKGMWRVGEGKGGWSVVNQGKKEGEGGDTTYARRPIFKGSRPSKGKERKRLH